MNYYALFVLCCSPCVKIVFPVKVSLSQVEAAPGFHFFSIHIILIKIVHPVEVALSQKEAAHPLFYWSNGLIQ